MLKCPKCGGKFEIHYYDCLEYLKCNKCDLSMSISDIYGLYEKAEAELEVTQKENNDLHNTIAGLKAVEKNFFEARAELAELKDKDNTFREDVLDAVMLSVDKWLEGDELKDNPETRAATAREKALKAIEKAQADMERIEALSVSAFQRTFGIGFATASRIIDLIKEAKQDAEK